MKSNIHVLISVSIVVAITLGFAGTGCKKAQNKDLSGSAATTGSAVSAEAGASAHLSPEELAKTELSKSETSGVAQGSAQQGQVQGQTQAQAPSAQPQGQSQAQAVAPAQIAPNEPACFTETFFHKSMAGHSDEESCSHHKNMLVLSHQGVNPAHVCVRVNGTPVKFERKGQDVLIGAIAGPKAKITVRYCTGKLTCAEVSKEDCTIPKDEFMDALGGSGADDTVQWDSAGANAENAKLNDEVKKELADIDGVETNEKGRNPAQASIFKEWIREEDAPACTKKQAS